MLRERLLTAFILGPLVIWAFVGLNAEHFRWMLLVFGAWMAWEYSALAGAKQLYIRVGYTLALPLLAFVIWNFAQPGVLQSFFWVSGFFWALVFLSFARVDLRSLLWSQPLLTLASGLIVILPTLLAFDLLREKGFSWLFYGLFLVWLADSAAYFAGRRFGRQKLAPLISPGKSWEGVYGAWVVCGFFALVMHGQLETEMSLWLFILFSLLVSSISVLGDLFESLLKRLQGIKDSGHLLPGHGGIMDRMDGFTAALPLMVLLLV
jgi:phosphatidate cytidylyltransferase